MKRISTELYQDVPINEAMEIIEASICLPTLKFFWVDDQDAFEVLHQLIELSTDNLEI